MVRDESKVTSRIWIDWTKGTILPAMWMCLWLSESPLQIRKIVMSSSEYSWVACVMDFIPLHGQLSYIYILFIRFVCKFVTIMGNLTFKIYALLFLSFFYQTSHRKKIIHRCCLRCLDIFLDWFVNWLFDSSIYCMMLKRNFSAKI